MHIKSSDTTKITSENATIWDYPINPEIGIAYQNLTGRGPLEGKYLNEVCHEIYFIISGTATFHLPHESYEVSAKDVIIIEPNTPHSIEADNLIYITITRPDWYEAQYKQVE